jgi:pilus assembly protein CpaF
MSELSGISLVERDTKTSGLPWARPAGRPSEASPALQPKLRPAAPARPARNDVTLLEIRQRAHKKLLSRLNLSNLDSLDRSSVRAEIGKAVQEILVQESFPLNGEEREELVEQVLDEIFGLGPLEVLLKDPTVSDILVNGHSRIWIERNGKLELTDVRFKDDDHLMRVIDRIVAAVGRRIDESSPMVDARLLDGSRVNAIIPPLAIDGPHLSIRKFKRDVLAAEDLVQKGAMNAEMLELLRAVGAARLNILISGGTGAGKTTLLNVLSSFIPHDERIVTIEDSAELQLRQPHVVRLETRPANIEGAGQITQRQLVINALRMRPERIILGEVRGAEAMDMLQAMNTGHDGSMATLHANTPRDALGRLETMIAMGGLTLPDKAVRQQMASAVNVVIQASRLSDGSRKITAISEVVGMEGEIITMQDIFVFEQTGVDPQTGRVIGRFRATGVRPRFAERLKSLGLELPARLFAES